MPIQIASSAEAFFLDDVLGSRHAHVVELFCGLLKILNFAAGEVIADAFVPVEAVDRVKTEAASSQRFCQLSRLATCWRRI